MSANDIADPPALALWPGEPPYSFEHQGPEEITDRPPRPGSAGPNRAIVRVGQPHLYVHRPARPNGTAVLVCPGGGFRYLEIDKEGHEIARWLADLGVTAVVLKYRTRPDTDQGSPRTMPEEIRRAINSDALQAMRTIRAHAGEWRIRPDRIGAMGFSAGGRLSAYLATMWREKLAPNGLLEQVSARPDFVAPIYPAIPEEIAARADTETPPVFMAVADNDLEVPPEHCLRFYNALRAAKVSAELHIYRSGGHGFGLGPSRTLVARWTDAFMAWLADMGMLGS